MNRCPYCVDSEAGDRGRDAVMPIDPSAWPGRSTGRIPTPAPAGTAGPIRKAVPSRVCGRSSASAHTPGRTPTTAPHAPSEEETKSTAPQTMRSRGNPYNSAHSAWPSSGSIYRTDGTGRSADDGGAPRPTIGLIGVPSQTERVAARPGPRAHRPMGNRCRRAPTTEKRDDGDSSALGPGVATSGPITGDSPPSSSGPNFCWPRKSGPGGPHRYVLNPPTEET